MKLSIIIPIYNVEQYLRNCVDSVLNQDISDYEIILVDDGSTDNSPQICDEFVSMNDGMSRANALNEPLSLNDGKPQIRVIHRGNGGLSAARNSGIEVAKGEYIMFVDSDDFIEPNVLGGLLAQVVQDELDVLRYKYQYVDGEGHPYQPYKTDPYIGNDYTRVMTDGVTFLNNRMNTRCYAWAFVVRRELLKDCIFTPGIYFEDTDWTPRMLVRAKRVASTDRVVYNYLLTRKGSITNAVNKGKQKKVLEDKMHLLGTLQNQAEDLKQKGLSNVWFSRMIADNVISIVGIISADFNDERKEYIERLNEIGVLPINSKSLKGRLINISPRLMIELLHLKN